MGVISTGGTRKYEDLDKKRYGEEWRYLWYEAVKDSGASWERAPDVLRGV